MPSTLASASAPDPGLHWVPVWRGSRREGAECGLVLETAALPYELVEIDGLCELWTPLSQVALVHAELERDAAERDLERAAAVPPEPFGGAAVGAIAYGVVLLSVAFCAGRHLFGIDWLDAGAIEASRGLRLEGWRAVTSLTLHLGPEHLLGNLLFGIGAGVLLSRQYGAGIAWLSILAAGAIANQLELILAPANYSAVGASTAVFAALGMLSGHAWHARAGIRQSWWQRTAPLGAGVALLALLGAGKQHVDVLGNLLGFATGIGFGWVYARAAMPRSRSLLLQFAAGAMALAVITLAWVLALRSAGA